MGTLGQADATSGASDYNSISFVISQLIAGIATSALVQVKAVTLNADPNAPGTVDVQPMVNQVDGAGNATPHGVIYGIPFFQLQGGSSAVIIDPAVDDIGIAVFASRDISSVKANRAVSNPGSSRTYDWADGLYLGGFLNAAATQWVRMHQGGGIDVKSTGRLTLTDGAGATVVLNGDNSGAMTFSAGLKITANTEVDGSLHVTGTSRLDGQVTGNAGADFSDDVTASGTSLHGHDHNVPGAQTGGPGIITTPPL
jgi:hypothetical protein